MSLAKREEVLAHLLTILENIVVPDGFPAIETVVRNRALLDNERCPGIALLDGDEATKATGAGRGRVRMTPVITILKPQVFVLLKLKKPQNEQVGQHINAYRGAVIKAVASDAQLIALIGANGDITYDGCETDLKTGMEMTGQIQLNFSISCVLDPYS
jgi:hypothetical protein